MSQKPSNGRVSEFDAPENATDPCRVLGIEGRTLSAFMAREGEAPAELQARLEAVSQLRLGRSLAPVL